MKILVQWAKKNPEDWEIWDSSDWPRLARKEEPKGGETLDDNPGWIAALCVQGVVITEGDHYHVESLLDGGCLVTVWADDPEDWPNGERWAKELYFHPLQPDPKFNGAINTKQRRVTYGEEKAMERLINNSKTDSFVDWTGFSRPRANLIHGIWIDNWEEHRKGCSRRGWREWTEHLNKEEVDSSGKLKNQREQDRYSPSEFTITYFQRDTDRATSLGADHEDSLERTTGTSATETVSLSSGGTTVISWRFTSPANDPDQSNWPSSGTYRCQLDVTVAEADVTYDVDFMRLNADLSAARSVAADGSFGIIFAGQVESLFSGTGLKLATVTQGEVDGHGNMVDFNLDQSIAQSDRYSFTIAATNEAAHGGAQDLTLELNTSDSFADGPWVETAAQTVEPNGFTVSPAFGTQEVSPGNVNIEATGFTNLPEFGTHRLGASISFTGFDNQPVFGTQRVDLSIHLTGFENLSEFGTVSLIQDKIVELTGFDNQPIFGIHRLGASVPIGGFENLPDFGTQKVSLSVPIEGFDSSPEFGTANVVKDQTIELTGFENQPTFGTQQLNLSVPIEGFDSLPIFGAQQINLSVPIEGFENLSEFGSHVVSQGGEVLVQPTGFENLPIFGTAQLDLSVPIESFDNEPIFGTQKIGLKVDVSSFSNLPNFGTAEVSVGNANREIEGFENQPIFGTQRINVSVPVEGFTNSPSFGTQKINLNLSVIAFAVTQNFGTANVVPGNTNREIEGFESQPEFGTASVVIPQNVDIDTNIDNAPIFGSPRVFHGLVEDLWEEGTETEDGWNEEGVVAKAWNEEGSTSKGWSEEGETAKDWAEKSSVFKDWSRVN